MLLFKSKQNKKFFALALPIFLELTLVNVVGNIDTIMLGRFSDEAVGAVGGITQALNIQNVLFGFISLGTGILVAQYVGAKNYKKMKEVISTSLFLNFIFSFLLALLYILFWRQIFNFMKLPEELVNIGKYYFLLLSSFCAFQALTLTSGAILKSYGKPKLMLFVNVGVNLLNILGNGMFLFGWLGMPILGTLGVGISTVFSRAIGCIFAIYLLKKHCHFQFSKKYFQPFPWKTIQNLLSIGIPTAGENLAWNIGQLLILSMINALGTNYIAARTYLMLITMFIMVFSISLGHATAIQIGQLVGAKKWNQAYLRGFSSLKLSFILAIVTSSTVFLLRVPIMSIFTQNEDILKISYQVFPYFILLESGRVFNIVIINALHASGDILPPMIVGIIFVFLVAVPFSYLFGIKFAWGLVGIWIANAMDEWIRGFAVLYRWKSQKWKTKSFIS